MPTPIDHHLYEKAKSIVYARYSKPSAYRSGALVKKYKELGGRYADDGRQATLGRWFAEQWTDVNPTKKRGTYPVYRPTVRVSDQTPLTLDEVDPRHLRQQSRLKQKLRGC